MKYTKIKVLQLLCLMGLILISCKYERDILIPSNSDLSFELPENSNLLSMAGVIGNFLQSGEIFTFGDSSNDPEFFLSGYVVSNDQSGNFFEELVIQDKPENPSVGIRIQIDVNPLYIHYEFGRKIFIRLNGLSIGEKQGMIQIGYREGNSIAKIPAPLMTEYIFRDAEVSTIVPTKVSIKDLNESFENLFVEITDVQFTRSLISGDRSITFAAEPTDTFNGERRLLSCNDNGSLILSTSTFADFDAIPLPKGRGSISGIVQRNFFDEFYTLAINSIQDIDFNNSDRCDPEILNCSTSINVDNNIIVYSEDFESFSSFESEGWINWNISNGSTKWSKGSFDNNNYAQISGFNTRSNDIQVWLISPSINLDSSLEEVLSFDIQTSFNNGVALTVWVSSDFSGDPNTASWKLLDIPIPNGNTNGFGSFESIREINLSCLSGDIHIGFFYQGSEPWPTTRYHLDNIVVSGN